MWLGLLHLTPDDGHDVEHDTAIVVAYEPHRLFSAGGAAAMAPQIVRMLREAGDRGAHVGAPRCGGCGAPLDVPPLDDREPACASA